MGRSCDTCAIIPDRGFRELLDRFGLHWLIESRAAFHGLTFHVCAIILDRCFDEGMARRTVPDHRGPERPSLA
jgi:hypothetical protein